MGERLPSPEWYWVLYTMIHPIPTIVVVDSEKTPEDQLRTMIILFRPTDSDIIKYIQSIFVFIPP